jgi:hypothetical protein
VTPTRVLAAVVALQLVAETALTPYWPLLLRALFGAEELAATGAFLAACRLAGLAALPLWALAARRWALPQLLFVSLLMCAAFDLGLALAPTLLSFTVLSAGVVAAGSALVLAYPALVAVVDGEGGDRIRAVLVGVGIVHVASLLATVVGAGVVALPQPRVGLALFAVADLALALLVRRHVVGRAPVPVLPTTPSPPTAQSSAAQPPPVAPVRARRLLLLPLPVVLVVVLAVLADAGTFVPRPFFTELVVQQGGSLGAAAVLFLLPSAGALAGLLVARQVHLRLGAAALPAAAALAAAGLALQAAAASNPAVLGAGRVVLGLGLGLLAVALDLRLFATVGTSGAAQGLVETARSAALLAAPLLATAAASVDLAAPLVVGAALLLAVALVSPALTERPAARVPALR